MGLIRKLASVSTLGVVDYRSKRDAEKKALFASAELAKAQAQQLRMGAGDPVAEKWETVVAAIEAGEASWDDLSRMQKLSMPISYQIRCKAAMKRRAGS